MVTLLKSNEKFDWDLLSAKSVVVSCLHVFLVFFCISVLFLFSLVTMKSNNSV